MRGTPEDRIQILEQALLRGMEHPTYQAYLKGAGLDFSAVAGEPVRVDRAAHVRSPASRGVGLERSISG